MSVWERFTSRKQWETYLKDLVATNDKALKRAIVLIYNNQTEEEKSKEESFEDNLSGFSKIDAKEMGEIARKILKGRELTDGEIFKSRNKMKKYWRQLMLISKKQARDKKVREQVREQMELESKIDEERSTRLDLFREYNEALRRCVEEGISCEYGICDECPVMTGFQMRMKTE